jgi:hypothetical protein
MPSPHRRDARDIPVVAELEDASVKRTMVWTPAW